MGKKKKKDKAYDNAKLAKKHGYDRHFYIESLGIDIKNCGTNFCGNDDERYETWMKERKKYGFDSRETWDLEYTFVEWMYEHLRMYKDKASKVINLEYHTFSVDGKTYTQIEAIDRMLELLEKVILDTHATGGIEEEDDVEAVREFLRIWSEVFPAMWW